MGMGTQCRALVLTQFTRFKGKCSQLSGFVDSSLWLPSKNSSELWRFDAFHIWSEITIVWNKVLKINERNASEDAQYFDVELAQLGPCHLSLLEVGNVMLGEYKVVEPEIDTSRNFCYMKQVK